VGCDASPTIMLVDLKDSIAKKFLSPLIQEFRYDKKDQVLHNMMPYFYS
jgi:hypothetical protein